MSQQVYPPLKVFLLGRFHLERKVGPAWQEDTNPAWQHRTIRILLAYLLSSPGRRRSREQVMDTLWPNLAVENATNRLNSTVHQLRQLLEPTLSRPANSHLLRVEPDILLLADATTLWVDIDVFRMLTTQAHTSTDRVYVEKLLEEAKTLYGGDFLHGEHSSEWVLAQREVYQRIWIGLLLELADHRLASNDLSSALATLNPILDTDPTNEAAVQRLMLALTRLQRRTEALQLYHQLVHKLKKQHEAVPLAETTRIFEAVRSGAITAVLANIPFSPGHAQPGTTDEASPELHEPHDPLTIPPQHQTHIGRSHQSPFVGRTEELSIMRNILHATAQAGKHTTRPATATASLPFGTVNQAPFLLLKGETGIGKTRLAEELSREALQHNWSVAWSRSYEQERDIPYRLWTGILRKAMLAAHDSLDGSHNQLNNSAFNTIFGSGTIQHLSTLLPELQQAIPAGIAPHSSLSAQEQLHLWEATRSFLTTLSHNRPLLIVLDDIQWADGSSLELLAYLTRRLHTQAAQPIVLLGTCRDTELEPAHPLRSLLIDLQREQAIIILNVQPLTQAQIGTLVAPLPAPIVQHIQLQAAGNPFFAEELARSSYATLSTASALELPQEQPRTNFLPETITAALQRRMSNLSKACQRLLSKAAVLGGSFELAMLQLMEYSSIASQNEDALLDLLDEALQAGVLTEESNDHIIMYYFWHPMIVSHLYEQLSGTRRAQLHRRAAEVLQNLYRQNVAEVAATITQHLLKGGSNPQHIATYAEIAGNRAYTLSAYPEAEHHYRLAIAQIDETQEQLMHLAFLYERLGECLMVRGHYEDAYRHYEHVLAIRSQQKFVSPEEQQREAQISALLWYEMGRASGYLNNPERGRKCNQHGEQVLHDAGVTTGVAWACLRLQFANICLDEGNFAEARHAALEALRLFEATLQTGVTTPPPSETSRSTLTIRTIEGDQSELGKIYELLGIIAGSTGQIAEQLTHLHTALTIFEQHSNIRAMANVCNNIGTAHLVKASYDAAASYFRRSLSLAERVGDIPLVSTACVNLGETAANTGNLLEAEEWYRRSLKLAEQVNIRYDMSYINNILATNLQEQGNLTGAYEAVRRALMLGREIRNATLIATALITLAQLRIVMAEEMQAQDKAWHPPLVNRLQRTQSTLQRALAHQGLAAEDIARAHLAQATLYLMQGNLKLAEDILRQTVEVAQQQEHMYFFPHAQRLLGCCLAMSGRHDEADAAFQQALHMSQQTGMRLEQGHALYNYGAILLQRSCPQGASFQTGLAHLQQAQKLFTACNAAIDLKKVNQILAEPTARPLPYSIHLLDDALRQQNKME